jgi:GntR family transcriptional regulator
MDFTESQAIYQQVADHVCEMILKRSWPESDRIPSVRELAMDLQVNPNTVNKAYAYLQDREVIHNQRGIGYFVSPSGVATTRELKREEFVAHDLPRVFRTMDLLGITLDDLSGYLEQYRSTNVAEGGEA